MFSASRATVPSGGSTTDSALQLLLGYDGLGRIFGGIGPGVGAAVGSGLGIGGEIGANFSGEAGLLRLFNAEFGGQISWFLPFALIALASGLWLRRRAGRTDRGVAAYLLWGSWLVVTGLVFSLMSGIVHTYYAVVLAPAVAALVGAGTVELWQLRSRTWIGGVVLGGAIAASAVWAWALLARTPDFAPGLGTVVLFVGVAAGLLIAISSRFVHGRLAVAGLMLAVAALMVGPAAYAVDTMGAALSGGDPPAGPTIPGSEAFGDGGRGSTGSPGGPDGQVDDGQGGFGGQGIQGSGGPALGDGGGAGGGPGGTAVGQDVLDYLVANQGDATWIVAVSGSGSAAPIQLATGLPVMTMGGFNGGDASPTLAEFQAYVANGQVRYLLANGGGFGGPGGGGGPGAPGADGEVATWAAANCKAVTVGVTTIFDCAATT